MAGTDTPQVQWDDEVKDPNEVKWDDEAPAAAAAASTPKPPTPAPRSWLGRAWDAGVEGISHAPDPSNLFSKGAGAVGDWANKKADEARTEEQKGVAAGGNAPAHPYLTPSAGYDLLARGAKTISGATSPEAAAVTAATIAAPEIAGPAMLLHGGYGAVQGAQDIARHGANPENVGSTINSAAEGVGGLGVVGHMVGTPTAGPVTGNKGAPGPIVEAIRNRNPIERGTQAYEDIITPNGTTAAQQLENRETMKRARPYLADEARRNPVLKKQPNDPTDPARGQQLGVANYRQNATAAADRLWNDKIQPITDRYGKVPVDGQVIAQGIRGTINPDSPIDVTRSKAINDLADFYEKTSSVEDANRKIQAINKDPEVVAYEKALPDKQAEMIATKPTLEAKIKAGNMLRDSVFKSIDEHGSADDATYLREARKDFGALKEVSVKLGGAQVPTPMSMGEKVIEGAHTAARPISRSGPQARRLFSNPNRLAARSSRLFGVSDLQPRVAPPQSNIPWYQSRQPGFIPPPGGPQPPPPVGSQFATEATGTVAGSEPGMRGGGAARIAGALPEQAASLIPPSPTPPAVAPQFATEATGSVTGTEPGMRGGGAARIAGMLPEQAASLVPPSPVPPPADPYFRYTGIGSIADEGTPITGRAATGTRFGPKGLLPGPIHGTPAQPVGGPPIMGFPADQGLWNVPPRPGNVPGFETPPNAFAEPPTGVVTQPGGIGQIGGTNEFAGRTPPDPNRPFPKGGVEYGVKRRTAFEQEADTKAAAEKQARVDKAAAKANKGKPAEAKPAEKPTDEQYQQAKNALKTPATLEPEELQKHRATVKNYEAAGKEQTAKDVEAAKTTGTANDRPQVKYKPSEKAVLASEKPKDYGPEVRAQDEEDVGKSMQKILDNNEASPAEKERARQYFKDNPQVGKPTEERKATPTAAERTGQPTPRDWKNEQGAVRPRGGINYRTVTEKGATWAVDPSGKYRISIKPGMKPAEVQAELEWQIDQQKNFKMPGEPEALSPEDKAAAEAAKAKRNAAPPKAAGSSGHNLFSKKNPQTSEASVDQVFGQDPAAEEKAATESTERREANRAERLRDISENAQRVFEGQEPTPSKEVGWLKMGAERAAAEPKPIQEEFSQDDIRNGEMAALADAEATLGSDKPGRYFDETAPGETNTPLARQGAGVKQFGSWRGVTSGRGLYPVLSRLPGMSATDVVRALRNPKSPAYQKVVRAAIEANKAEKFRSAKLGLKKE